MLVVVVANVGRTGADARDITGLEIVRRPASSHGPLVSVPDVGIAQLHPAQSTREPVLDRNPFTFAPRSLPPAPAPLPVSIAPPPTVLPDIPPSVVLSLVGVATTTRPDGRVERTAIITSPDAFYMVREADAVTARYRVDAVLADSVVLVDGASGASLHLVLR